jgi:C_GCAxxG_C_C family probable redox protein
MILFGENVMNRREFCRTSLGGLAATALGVSAATGAVGDREVEHVDPERLAKRALEYFLPGKRTCGESLLAAGCEEMGIRSEMIPDIALGLGGGIGRRGHTCGVITGSALALGLASLRRFGDYAKRKSVVMEGTDELSREFEKQFGATDCRTLCGLDLTTPEGRRELAQRVKRQTCGRFVAQGARMLADRLNEMLRSGPEPPRLALDAAESV